MEVIVWVGYITGRSRAPRCPLFMQGLQARPHAEHQILLQLSAADQPAHQRGTVTQRWAAAAQERAWRTAATGRMAAARAAALRASSSARRRASCSSAALACACAADARASAYGTCPNPNPVSHTAPAARPPRWAGQPNLGGVGQGRLTSEAARWYCCACSAAACACACAARSCACSAACCCRICACICACSWRWKATCAICAPACARPHDRTHVTAPHPLSPSVQQKIILLPRHEAETLNTYFQKDAWLASQPLCQRAQGEAQTRQQQEWSAGERPRGARGGAPAAAAPSAAAGAARRRP